MKDNYKLLVTARPVLQENERYYDNEQTSNEYIEHMINEASEEYGFKFSITYAFSLDDQVELFTDAIKCDEPFDGIIVPVGHGDENNVYHFGHNYLDKEYRSNFGTMIAKHKIFEAWRHVPGYRGGMLPDEMEHVDFATRAKGAHSEFKKWIEGRLLRGIPYHAVHK